MASKNSGLSLTTLVVGTAATAASAVLAFFYADSVPVLAVLLIALDGLAVTLILDQRVKLAEVEHLAAQANSMSSIELEIDRLSRIDVIFRTKYAELQSEIADLARGTYRIRTLTSLYQDDIRSIDRLRSGEVLLSTCPVTPASVDEAMRQVSAPAYRESMRAHIDASARGVRVTRVYLLRDRGFLEHPPLLAHLDELDKAGLEIRVIFRDQTILEGQFDFLVFGSAKVSIGVAEPGAGTVSGAVVYTDPTVIRTYMEEYAKLTVISTRLSSLSHEKKEI